VLGFEDDVEISEHDRGDMLNFFQVKVKTARYNRFRESAKYIITIGQN